MFLLISAGLGMPPTALAGTAAPRDAREIARAVEAHYRSVSTMKAVFLETYREGRGNTRVESGTVYFRHSGQMRWEYEAPERKLFLVDGKHVWFYVPGDHTASRASIKKSADWRTPFALLTGKANLERLCRRIELLGPGASAGQGPKERITEAGDMLLRCLPRDQDAPQENLSGARLGDNSGGFREVLIEVNMDSRLVRVVVREPGDRETEIRFGNWQENLSLAETMFHFNPPLGVAIVDEASLGDWSR